MSFASACFNKYSSLSNNHVGWQLFAYLQNYSLFFRKNSKHTGSIFSSKTIRFATGLFGKIIDLVLHTYWLCTLCLCLRHLSCWGSSKWTAWRRFHLELTTAGLESSGGGCRITCHLLKFGFGCLSGLLPLFCLVEELSNKFFLLTFTIFARTEIKI